MTTIADVARRAGVSVSTVSYVLSGKRKISTETQRKVRRAADALGYHPNAGARALASRRSRILALVMPTPEYFAVPVGMEFAHAVTAAARTHGYDILLMTGDEGDEGLHRLGDSALVDGGIVMEVSVGDPRVRTIRRLGLPATLLGQPDDARGVPWVDLDFRTAGTTCVEHLAELGHQTIGFVGPNSTAYQRGMGYAVRTLAGVRSAARRLDVELLTRRTPRQHRDVAPVVRKLLDAGVTALIVHDQRVLSTVDGGLRADGVRVPDDLSVLAISSSGIADDVSLDLSYVELPVTDMAAHAVQLLADTISGVPSEHRYVLLPPHLRKRGSTAPALRRRSVRSAAPAALRKH